MRRLEWIFWRTPVIEHVGAITGMGAAAGRVNHASVRMAVLLAVVAALNLVDLLYTMFAHSVGELREMNPLASAFLECGLESSLVCYKILLVLAGGVMLWKLRRSRWAAGGCWVLVTAYAALAIMWWAWVQEVMVTLDIKAMLGAG